MIENTQTKIDKFQSIGTTITRINIEDISKISCVVPPTGEQVEIAATISAIEKTIEEKTQKPYMKTALEKCLMQDLLTGKVRVSL